MKFTAQILLILCIFIHFNVFSQNKTLDSLQVLIQQDKQDTNKVKHLNLLMSKLIKLDPSRVQALADETILLSRKLKYPQGSMEAAVWKAAAQVMLGENEKGFSALKIISKKAEAAHLIPVAALAYFNLTKCCNMTGNFSEGIAAATEALRLHTILRDEKSISEDHNFLGNMYGAIHNNSSALEHHYKSLALRKKRNDTKNIAGSYHNIASIYLNLHKYTDALEMYTKASEVNQKINNNVWLSYNYIGLGNVYSDLAKNASPTEVSSKEKNFIKAAEMINKAIEIRNDTSDLVFYGTAIHNLADARKHQALLLESKDQKKEMVKVLNECLDIFEKVLSLRRRTNDAQNEGNALTELAEVELKLKNHSAARKYIIELIELSKATGILGHYRTGYQYLAHIDSIMGNYAGAFSNYKMFIVYRDSIENTTQLKKSLESKLNYEFATRRSNDSLITAQKAMIEQQNHKEEIEKQKLFTYFGIAGIFLMFLIAGISLFAYRNKQKANTIIVDQKIKLEVKQKELTDSIVYAQRIQNSLLPSEKMIERKLRDLKKS